MQSTKDSTIVFRGLRQIDRNMERNLPAVKVPQNIALTYAPSAMVVCSNDLTAKVVRYTPITISAPTYRTKKTHMRATNVTSLKVVFCRGSLVSFWGLFSTFSPGEFSFLPFLFLIEPYAAMTKNPRLDAITRAPEIG